MPSVFNPINAQSNGNFAYVVAVGWIKKNYHFAAEFKLFKIKISLAEKEIYSRGVIIKKIKKGITADG